MKASTELASLSPVFLDPPMRPIYNVYSDHGNIFHEIVYNIKKFNTIT